MAQVVAKHLFWSVLIRKKKGLIFGPICTEKPSFDFYVYCYFAKGLIQLIENCAKSFFEAFCQEMKTREKARALYFCSQWVEKIQIALLLLRSFERFCFVNLSFK